MSERTITVNGCEVEIPPEIVAQTKFTKLGAVDKRADHAAFDAWLESVTGPVLNGDESRQPEDVIQEQGYELSEIVSDGPVTRETDILNPETHTLYQSAQALLERIWAGQANDLKMEVRHSRIVAALQDKGLPTDKLDWPDERPAPVKPGEPPKAPERVMSESELQIAQAYALKVWSGQEFSLGRSERVARVRRALEGQGLSMHGVELPRG